MAGLFDISPSDWTTLFIFLFVFLTVFVALRKPAGLPPGPPMLVPGLGHLLSFIGTDPLPVFARWKQEYGDVYSFYLGKRLFIVLSGYTTMKEALVFQGFKFAGRPRDPLMSDYIKGNKGIIFASGDQWKQERKFVAKVLQQLHFGRPAFEKVVHQELEALMTQIESFNGEACDVKDILQYSVANIIRVIITGDRADIEDAEFKRFLKIQDEFTAGLARASVIMDNFPVWKHLPGDLLGLKHIMDASANGKRYLTQLHSYHAKTCDNTKPRDMMAIFIKENREGDGAVDVYDDLFGAGTETTSTTLLWILLYLLHYPDIQAKCREEIHAVLGEHQLPTMKDKPNLPFVSATIYEGLRIANVVMMSVPHAPLTDTTFQGYRIPRDATILLNMQSIFHDAVCFPDPSRFRPDRFLTEDGRLEIPEYLIPFGIGRRVCLGEAAAKMELFLILTSLLQRFEICSEDGTPPPLQGKFSISYAPSRYKIRFQRSV